MYSSIYGEGLSCEPRDPMPFPAWFLLETIGQGLYLKQLFYFPAAGRDPHTENQTECV